MKLTTLLPSIMQYCINMKSSQLNKHSTYMLIVLLMMCFGLKIHGYGYEEPISNFHLTFVKGQLNLKSRFKIKNSGGSDFIEKTESCTENVSSIKAGLEFPSSIDSWLTMRGEFEYMFPTEIERTFKNPNTTAQSFYTSNSSKLQAFQLNGILMLRLPLVPQQSPVRLRVLCGIGVSLGFLHFKDDMLDEASPFIELFPTGGAELLLFNRVSISNEYSYSWGMSGTEKGKIYSSKFELRYFIENFRTAFGINYYL